MHTPGPWKVMWQNLRPHHSEPQMWSVPIQVGSSDPRVGSGNVLATAYGCHNTGEPNKAECEGNARLIAAAPDLLEACEWLADVLDTFIATSDQDEETATVRANARAAIAKAKGEVI